MAQYVIPVRSIKSILRKEHQMFIDAMPLTSVREYYYHALQFVLAELENCRDYEELEHFVHITRSMSLQEWIDTL